MVKEISKYAYEESVITYIIYAFSAKASLMTRIEYEAESAARQTCEFQISERALTMSPDQDQYIWRKTISHIEVGMGSGVFPV